MSSADPWGVLTRLVAGAIPTGSPSGACPAGRTTDAASGFTTMDACGFAPKTEAGITCAVVVVGMDAAKLVTRTGAISGEMTGLGRVTAAVGAMLLGVT
jgi:hypothetical protein